MENVKRVIIEKVEKLKKKRDSGGVQPDYWNAQIEQLEWVLSLLQLKSP